MKRLFAQVASAAFFIAPALAEPQYPTTPPAPPPPPVVILDPATGLPLFTSANPGNVTASVTASISGFQPTPAYAALAVGASSTRVALPTGAIVIVYNTGANAASVTLGNASIVATGANDIIQPNSWVAFTVGANVDLAGIEATGAAGTTSLVISGGTGLPTGAGGGGGGSSGGSASFLSSGSYLNVASVAFTSANSALPTGTNAVLYNYGGYKIIYQLSTSGASTVTAATADGVLQPGGTIEVAVGTNTNIAYATTSSGLTSSLQVVGGTGLWTGSQNNNLSVGLTGITGPLSATEIGGLDNSSLLQPFGVTAAGTSSTKPVIGAQGVTGGIPFLVNPGTATLWGLLTQGSATSGALGQLAMGAVTTSAPSYTPAQNSPLSLTPSGALRTDSSATTQPIAGFTPTPSYATGTTSASDQNVALPTGTEFILTNTGANAMAWNMAATATGTMNVLQPSSWISFAGTAAAAFHYIEATGAGTTTFSLSGGVGIPTGAGGGSSGSSGNVFQATLFNEGTASTAATTQVFALSGATTIYLVNYAYQTDAAATGNGTFQIVTGTGTNCSTINKTLTPVWNFAQNAGISEGSLGVLGASSAGDELCVVTTASQKVNWRIGVVQQ